MKNKERRSLSSLFWFLAGGLSVLALGAALYFLLSPAPFYETGEAGTGGRNPVAECGAQTEWDRDGDTISDSTEENPPNQSLHRFSFSICDQDASRPRGKYHQGALQGGVNLRDKGPGYVHFRGSDPVDGDDWGALVLINCLEEVARRWQSMSGGRPPININDLSRKEGGKFNPHKSHQNGLEVDIRYVRSDGQSLPLDIRRNPESYDPDATLDLIDSIVKSCAVEVVFAADWYWLDFTNEDLTVPIIVPYPNHTNHFHVRLSGPAR